MMKRKRKRCSFYTRTKTNFNFKISIYHRHFHPQVIFTVLLLIFTHIFNFFILTLYLVGLLLEQFLQSHKSEHLSPSLTRGHLRLAHQLATVIHFKFFIFNQPTMIFKSQRNVDCWKSVSRCRLGSTFSKVVQ